ncbi:TonB-dependent receptor [Olivibacter sp. XZL3]|uniref:SusC/RagA family TonB-linked outer membrane protein n=1 Tax=Olivibacter sp. XZL3 TaxID=1735116 RepID=UPI001F0EF409|nr:TonB-dependent receptor [Olivibacter sp. XZL3]
MKLTIILLLLFQFQAFSEMKAQSKVSLKLKSASIADLLAELETKTDFRFVFNQNAVFAKNDVNVTAEQESVVKILDRVLAKKGISYTLLEDNLIVINDPTLQKMVTGVVVDETGDPLPGVSVRVKGVNRGAVTDANGRYQVEIANGEVLVFTYIGYENAELTYTGQAELRTGLKLAAEGLDEVVVVGYGTQKKVNLTGSVATIKQEDINRQPVGQASQALQGLSAGLTVTTNSGQPGRDQGALRIRGLGTLNDNSPLVLIDGVRYDNSISLNDIDANDIESVSVLKDAAAASIYGVRAANGVILVTTKRGAANTPQINYGNYFGWQEAIRTPDFVGAQDYMNLVNLMYTNSGGAAQFTQERINAYNDPNRDPIAYPDNNWYKDVLSGSGFQQQHNISLSGGSEKTKYRFSGNYFDQAGLVKNMNFDRLTLRLNTDFQISEKLDFTADLSARIANRNEPQAPSGDSPWFQFGQAYLVTPIQSSKDADGNWRALRGENNMLRLQEEGGLYSLKDQLYSSNLRLNYRPVEGMTLSAVASNNMQTMYNSQHTKQFTYVNLDAPIGRNDIRKIYTGYRNENYQALANYEKTFNKHYVKVLGGASYLNQYTDNLSGMRLNLPNGNLSQIDAGAADGQVAEGSAEQYTLISYFGRINYTFNDKYLFEANIRRDGSSRFSDGQRWGWFPSASAGWRISEEDFMKNVSFVQDLKLRASYGVLGNDALAGGALGDNIDGNYPYQSNYFLNSYPIGGVLYQTAGLRNYPNSGLTWETTNIANFGLDFTLVKKLNVTFDYFDKRTKDILFNLPIPSSVGLEPTVQNAVSVKNTGWELALNYQDQIGDEFKYTVGLNVSDVRNEITDLKGADQVTINSNNVAIGNFVGQPINAFYGYQVAGIYQTAEQVAQSAVISSAVGPGDLMYQDLNNDGVFDNVNDFAYLGSNIPRYNYGINLGASYKNFDFSAFLQGVGKVDVNTLNIEKARENLDGNIRSNWLDSWTPENTDAAFPRLITSAVNYQPSSFWIKSGAYLRLKNVSVGYRLPKSLLAKTFINNLRIFATGQNLLTFSSLPKDVDPEAPNDIRYYPQVRTLTFGLNANF